MNYAVWESAADFKRGFNNPEFRAKMKDYPPNTVAAPTYFRRLPWHGPAWPETSPPAMRQPALLHHGPIFLLAAIYVTIRTRMEQKVIPILHVKDAEVGVAWYQRLGFEQTSVHRFQPGFPAFVTTERGSMKLFLSEHKGDARPDTLIYLHVADVHPIAKEFGVRVEEAPWGYEIELRDPDTNRLRIGMPKPASKSV